MPIYEYELGEGSCPECPGRFEARQHMSDPPLSQCPKCQRAVRRVFSRVAVHTPITASRLKEAGMTRLRRLEHGVYEADGAGSGLLDMSDGLPPKETEDVPEYHIDGDMNITQIDLPKKTGSSDPTSELQPKQERVKKNRQSLPYYDLISVH